MSATQICSQLLSAEDEGERSRLLDAASETPECVELFLLQGQSALVQFPENSLRCATFAETIAQRRGEPEMAANALRLQGQALRVLGRHPEAVDAINAGALLAERGGNRRLAAQIQIGVIDSLSWIGRFDEAVLLARRLEDVLRSEGAEEDAAKVLVNLGNQYFRRDMYPQALDCYDRALAVVSRYGDPVAEARIRSNCANILTMLDRYDEAITLFEQARTVFVANGLDTAAAIVDGNHGWLQYVSGKYAVAVGLLLRAKMEFTRRGQELEMAKCDGDLADVYRELNLFPEARLCYERAIPVFERVELTYEQARAELGLAAVRASEEPEAALQGLGKADAIFQEQKNPLMSAQVRLIRAYLLRSLGQVSEASTQAQQAEQTFVRNRMHGWAAEARFLLADVGLEEGRDTTRQMGQVVRAAKRHLRGWLECRAHRALGKHFAGTDTGRALRHLRLGVSVLEAARTLIAPEDLHVAFMRDKLDIYEDLVRVLLTRATKQDIREALNVVERAKSRLILERLQSSLEAGNFPMDENAAQARAKLDSLRAELSRSYHRLHAFGEDNPRRRVGDTGIEALAPLETAYRLALRDAELIPRLNSATSLSISRVVSEKWLRAMLARDETLIEFYIVQGEVCAFVLTREQIDVRYGVARLEDVQFASRRLRYHLKKLEMADGYTERHDAQLYAGIREVLKRLYDLLLAPLDDLITTEKLVIVPHGVLHGLPFHAFFDGEQYAIDRREVIYAPSAGIWYAGVERAKSRNVRSAENILSRRALILGVSSPGTERVSGEVEQIAHLAKDSYVLQGEQAQLQAFRDHAGSSGIIHIATHALYRADNPLFSGLRFADGWLLARDLYEIPLNCELATLSACHTGVASVESGDELFGLIRGFLCAGARTLAASLWPADDAATATLMVTFYNLLSSGASKASSLRTAQIKIREAYPHPYHWAAFAMFGLRS